jgi:hypothetical protein
MDDPYATVGVRNPNGREGVFTARINFRSRTGSTVRDTVIMAQVRVPAHSTVTQRTFVTGANSVEKPERCAVDRRAAFDW